MKQLLFLPAMLLSMALFSQDILKTNGLSINGKFFYKAGNQVLFITSAGDSIVLDNSSFTFEFDGKRAIVLLGESDNKKSSSNQSKDYYESNRILLGQFDFGFTILSNYASSNGYDSEMKPAGTASLNVRFNDFFMIGLGSGFETFGMINSVPVYFKVAGNFAKQRVTPYYDINIGHGFGFTREIEVWDGQLQPEGKAGYRFNPNFGIRFQDRVSSMISLGLIRQTTVLTSGWIDWRGNPNTTTQTRKINYIAIRIGFLI